MINRIPEEILAIKAFSAKKKLMRRLFFYIFIALMSVCGLYAQTDKADSVKTIRSTSEKYSIYYPVSRTHLQEDYMGNDTTLLYIRNYLNLSPHIDSIVIYSYASPEGPYAFNKYLSRERGITAFNYIRKHISERFAKDADKIVRFNPTAENWDGLKEEVLKYYNRPDLNSVLEILQRSGISNDERKKLLKRLDGGQSWQFILKHCMPQLRHATWQFVGVHPMQAFTHPEMKPALFPTAPITTGLAELPELPKHPDKHTILALKTNLLYDLATWANFSVEVPVYKDRWSVLYYHQFSWWRGGENNNEYCMRFLSIGAEARYWFRPMPRMATSRSVKRDKLMGHFLGVYAESGKWDFERKRDICYQGEHWSAGLSYGYAMPLGKRLNLELSLSAGYASIPRRNYYPTDNYELLIHNPEKDGTWHYWGPTKAQVSIVLPILVKKKKGGER